tara:strand:- start:159 stop:617 length:459 start_codon:yes stop_codon:yes gene_type:complete
MKVILLENLAKIGSIGEIIDVKRGFARNYLILNKKALYASKQNIKEVEKIKSELNKKDQEKKKQAKQTFDVINNKTYVVKKLITENNDLYGSIKPTEISKLINSLEKIDVKPSLIQPLKEIKSIGTFKVKINLHSDVQAEITIKVISEDSIK